MALGDTPEEKQEELIKKAYDLITRYEMDVPAVLLLETIKPLVWVGGGLLRMLLSPYMMLFWNEGHALIDTFQERRNIEKLIRMIEDKHREEVEAKKRREAMEEELAEGEKPAGAAKKGWRRFFRF